MVDKCTVCASEAIVSPRPNDLLQDVVCPTCGKYRSGLHFGFDAPKHILSGVIREASDDGRDITVTSEKRRPVNSIGLSTEGAT